MVNPSPVILVPKPPEVSPYWKTILKKAWSVRLMAAAVVLSGFEILLPLIQPYWDVPAGVFAGVSMITVMGALLARILVQKNLPDI